MFAGYVTTLKGTKVHGSFAAGEASWCRSVRQGSTFTVVAEWSGEVTDAAQALQEAGVQSTSVCESCLGGVKAEMELAG